MNTMSKVLSQRAPLLVTIKENWEFRSQNFTAVLVQRTSSFTTTFTGANSWGQHPFWCIRRRWSFLWGSIKPLLGWDFMTCSTEVSITQLYMVPIHQLYCCVYWRWYAGVHYLYNKYCHMVQQMSTQDTAKAVVWTSYQSSMIILHLEGLHTYS